MNALRFLAFLSTILLVVGALLVGEALHGGVVTGSHPLTSPWVVLRLLLGSVFIALGYRFQTPTEDYVSMPSGEPNTQSSGATKRKGTTEGSTTTAESGGRGDGNDRDQSSGADRTSGASRTSGTDQTGEFDSNLSPLGDDGLEHVDTGEDPADADESRANADEDPTNADADSENADADSENTDDDSKK